jgi:hypothetical protein
VNGHIIEGTGSTWYSGTAAAFCLRISFEREDGHHMIGFDGQRFVRDLTAVK